MGQAMHLGSGPAPAADRSFGVPALDTVLGPPVAGENIVWGLEDDVVPGIRRRIEEGAGGRAVHCSLDGLTRAAAEAAERRGATIIVDLTDAAAAPGTGRLRDCALAVFGSSSTCHWLVPRTVLEHAAWTWAMQCVLIADAAEVAVYRADGRAGTPLRVPLDSAPGSGFRRSPVSAWNLGRGLRAARTEKGWSQAELGRRVGVSASAISQMERGRLGLSLETVIEVADQFGIAIDQLLRGGAADFVVVENRPGIGPDHSAARPVARGESVARESLHTYVLGGGGTLTPPVGPSGRVTVLIGSGRVAVERSPQRTMARAGDIVGVNRAQGFSISNLGAENAVIFCL
ncbi:helix-turn-helix domain-containing protein [Nocardia sp. NBC_00416]|uniref:helix-turn-helix domain-containing protein n=1 Tax=Nocardia sp. NBC_00416 TaxID=2975991 RepID=UPI002E20EA42